MADASNHLNFVVDTKIGENQSQGVYYNLTRQNISSPPASPPLGVEIRIIFYCIIFVLSIAGNALVILTLIQNRRMRTVTNVFLLNLSVSDLLLAVFCMPFTLIPTLLRDFIFGYAMCVMIRYMQGKYTMGLSVYTCGYHMYMYRTCYLG